MGRKKIQITRIQDERNRQITFSKRKAGLLKKAYELSILCDVEIAVIMITHNSKLYQYASSNMNSILIRYTEFKDPDESKTNADILEDITKKEKSGRSDDSGDEDDTSAQIPLTPNTHAHYQRIDEEFDQVLHHTELPSTVQEQQPHPSPIPPPIIIPSKVPQAMPVSVPVSGGGGGRVKLGSAGSSHSDSPSTSTPGSKGQRSPLSGGSMPPPLGTPTRLQTIRSQTLKLHLPGGGRNYIPLGQAGKSPSGEDSTISDGDNSEANSGRPQLRVVIPGQKGFVPRTLPSSPPPVINVGDPVSSPSSASDNSPVEQPIVTSQLVTTTINTDSLNTPIMSLTTPSLFSSLPPGLSNIATELPLGSSTLGDIGSTSALVAFPVSIQPSSVSTTTPGSNIILQAQNMGQPFLLTPTPYDKPQTTTASIAPSSLMTPPSTLATSSGLSSLRDLEQLKQQYDRIYQQISQTLQQHSQHQSHDPPPGNSSDKPQGKRSIEREETFSSESEPPNIEMSSSKRSCIETNTD